MRIILNSTVVIVQSLSHVQLFATPMDCSTPGFHALYHLPEFAQTHAHWCIQQSHPVVPFSSCFQSFPASGAFPMSWLFTSGSQNIGASASPSVPSVYVQDWFPLELISLIFLESKGLSRVFSKTTLQKHQFFGSQPSLRSNS